MKRQNSLTVGDRFYWFRINAVRAIACFAISPVFIIYRALELIKIVLVCDGSCTLMWPWERWPHREEN